MEIIEQGEQILKYIPQRNPFVLVDKVFQTDEKTITTGFSIPEKHIMVENRSFKEGGMVENIAQSAAMHVGYHYVNQNKKVPLGFIASIKNLQITGVANSGDELITEIEVMNEVMQIKIVSGKIRIEEKVIAECELRVYINEE